MFRALSLALLMTASACALCRPAVGQDIKDLPPYKMIRALQYVQDSVVLGDHSAIEMQRYMLGAIDERLRSSDSSIFADPRNTDAALIYAMSGGNPETLAFLTSRDIEGNFDMRITDALRQYLAGKGALTLESLTKVTPEYKASRLGPYLYLILGNAASLAKPVEAMKHYDMARLMAPGTIIEEAALRRCLALARQADMPEKGFRYALTYARRFMTSPYASQFADLFVEIVVKNHSAETEEKILEIIAFMDRPRQREVFLRIARRAAIAGMQTLARLAASNAEELSEPGDSGPNALAELYSGLADVPSPDVLSAMNAIAAIPDEALTPRDRALRRAAKAVAEEVLRQPTPDSLTQATPNTVDPVAADAAMEGAGSPDSPFAAPEQAAGEVSAQADAAAVPPATDAAASSEITDFVASGRSTLAEIDSLLEGKTKNAP